MSLTDVDGTPVLLCGTDGEPLRGEREAMDLIANSQGAVWVLVPVERLTPEFFQLRTGVAGEIVQKFVTYGLGLAVLGDISTHLADSDALNAFVQESNRGRQTWFLPDLAAFRTHLAAAHPSARAPRSFL